MTSRFTPLLLLAFVLVLSGCTQTFLVNGKPAVIKWAPFHNPEHPPDTLITKTDIPKAPDTDRGDALVDFLTEDIKEEMLFPARIAEIADRKNETFLALVAFFSLLFLARFYIIPAGRGIAHSIQTTSPVSKSSKTLRIGS